jgi:uncharacterized protein (DUF4415 family)
MSAAATPAQPPEVTGPAAALQVTPAVSRKPASGAAPKTAGSKKTTVKPTSAKATPAKAAPSKPDNQTPQSVQKKSPRRGIRLKIDDDLDGEGH